MALYVVVSAAGEVCAASYFQQADVFVALLLSFAAVCLMFNLLARHEGGEARLTKRSLPVLVSLNVVTAISWIGLFIGLKYAEPAIVVAFMVALGPTATVWLNALIRRQGVPPASDVVVSVTIAAIGCYMIWISASGNAGMEWGTRSSFGIVLAIVAGLSLALTNILVKLLFDRGFFVRQVLAHRFYATILLLLGLADYSSLVLEISQHWLAIATIGLSTIIVPLLLIQAGIRRVEPFTVNMVLSTPPIITFLFQYFDSRIVPSSHTFVGNVLITAVASGNIYLQYRRSA
ncbi:MULTISPECIES: DMT family transporter [Bradyrhizobium]|uniref:DMT family transporter n=1 Tax=Bradyrhizobium quebecense TaxID=2748629 RepID=A0ACD3V2E5_9BRAD|nr:MULTISPECIES: DMT family transporter [Bradyrhizobium]UFX44292.1 DMT family transporter [Bradyrhizobium sp. 41S5]UGA44313.1 DMT family transporter [Bradyrhizobium quebecense]UGY00537.1 DMT family transporter [Bradyrhizobium quebecense]